VTLPAVIRSGRLLRFITVGLVVTATDFAIFNGAMALLHQPARGYILAANTLAFAAATLVGYSLNSRYTFRAQRNRHSLGRYALIAIVGAGVYDGSLFMLLHLLADYDLLMVNLAKMAAVSFAAAWNFLGFSLFVFRAPSRERVEVAS
jgi:putative flippase GtrA